MKPDITKLIPIESVFTVEWFKRNKWVDFFDLLKKVGIEYKGMSFGLGEYCVKYDFHEVRFQDGYVLRGKNWLLYDIEEYIRRVRSRYEG